MAHFEFAQPGLHTFLAQELRRRVSTLSLNTPILDVGCGSGAWLSRLSELGFCDLVGIDNGSLVDLPLSNQAICYRRGDLDTADDLGFGRRFGLITAIEILEHLENPGLFWRHIRRSLADDGYVLVTTPNIHAMRNRLSYAATAKLAGFDPGNPRNDGHIYPVYLVCLQRILSRYGFEVADGWTYPLTGGLNSGVLRHGVAKVLAAFLPDRYPGDTLCLLIRKCDGCEASSVTDGCGPAIQKRPASSER
jgi:SAM-dependent methyltransferase